MNDESARLRLPYILPSQAQKHVTHNEALDLLDLLVQLSVAAFDADTPPSTVQEGQVWALGPAPVGAWAGQGDRLAAWQGEGWRFIAPQPGWRAASGNDLRVWTGSGWARPVLADITDVAGVGINTGFDATNRLAVSSAATLLTHDGAGHHLKINKAGAGDTAGVLFQTGWSGRAELGTAGSDDFSIKVSPDGGAWHTGIALNRSSGNATLKAVQADAITGTAVTQGNTDTTAGRLLKVGDFGLGSGTAPHIPDFTAALRPGLYRYLEASSTNAPGTGAAWFGAALVLRPANTGGRVTVIAARADTSAPKIWIGARSGDTGPLEWAEIYTAASIVGTVSQSSGVPTGAIIQRGSGPNGHFSRFADGTQICTHVVNLGSRLTHGAGTYADPYRTANSDWDFPAAFVTAPVCAGTAVVGSTVGSQKTHTIAAESITSTKVVRAQAIANASNANDLDVTIHFIATGRWF